MKVLGLIVEYNPFHNGHLYHIEQSRKISSADCVVCVMSGNFIQRGEPAIINKWARAKMALLSGVDLVIELPLPYAVSSAEYFAYGAVKILHDIGIIDCICFGSETGSIKELDIVAQILIDEPESYRTLLKEELDKGLSYPVSRESALRKYLATNGVLAYNIEEIIGSSNNILGIEYLKALKRLKSSIEPLTIKRINNKYNSEDITGSISSATSIRKHILNSLGSPKEDILETVLPKASLDILREEIELGRGPVFTQDYEQIITAILRKMTADQIKTFPYVSEGLENRIKNAANLTGTFEELVDSISTKRYTKTRIQRILMSILAGITVNDLDLFNRYGGPQYARVLGFNNKGKQLMSLIKQNSIMPLVLKTADFIKSCNPLLKRMLELESLATDMYVIGYKNPDFRNSGQEFTQNIIRIIK
ncbi:MAG: nucleotidyltransferase [Bacillota bacterium]